jgi:hypothetical protein
MKLLKALKNKTFKIKDLKSKPDNIKKNIPLNSDDKLFFILNIGNHEYAKNKSYLTDEIEFRIDAGDDLKCITDFIKTFIKNSYGIKINAKSFSEWVNSTYKHRIEASKAKRKRTI